MKQSKISNIYVGIVSSGRITILANCLKAKNIYLVETPDEFRTINDKNKKEKIYIKVK